MFVAGVNPRIMVRFRVDEIHPPAVGGQRAALDAAPFSRTP